jgi:lipopolysaccharide/colanic/teichoic acid biosynthesis glycosyltransferase
MNSRSENQHFNGYFGQIAPRIFDVAIASVLLLVLSPLILVISFIIVLESGRPIFFRHERLGLRGRKFMMVKFRKFHKHCSAHGQQLTSNNDNRFTAFGALLARTKLDELPQLWNILNGDMAIVGPRPESIEFADCFKSGFEEVLEYRPGLVGPSQMFFRDESDFYPGNEDPTAFYRKFIFPAKAGIDIAYFRHRSLLSDLRWLWRSGRVTIGLTG